MISCNTADTLSSFFSIVSCTSWIFAQSPQIYHNYVHKSAEGVSPHFLALWFLGDFLSFTSCLLNDVVLRFQIYLSIFFLLNDLTLCSQYYYYNYVFIKPFSPYVPVIQEEEYSGSTTKDFEQVDTSSASSCHVIHQKETQSSEDINEHQMSHSPSVHESSPLRSLPIGSIGLGTSYDSVNNSTSTVSKIASMATLLSSTNALPIHIKETTTAGSSTNLQLLGMILAWMCTFVYMFSRCPQLWKNYKRKSVDGLSPLLFTAALMGNLCYTISILTNCEFINGAEKWDYFVKQLPYILGSSGTLLFDCGYFYQRRIYHKNTPEAFTMENWSDLESHES